MQSCSLQQATLQRAELAGVLPDTESTRFGLYPEVAGLPLPGRAPVPASSRPVSPCSYREATSERLRWLGYSNAAL